MKQFLIQILIFLGLLGALCFAVFCQADGTTDDFYSRFASPKQTSLILGSSRAAQGLDPAMMNEVLNRNDIYNYSFSIAHSPYGPAYLESVKRKTKPDAKNGIFILTVDPWSISCELDKPEDSLVFGELDLAVAKTKIVDMHPNIPYLLAFYDKSYINLLLKRKDPTSFLHKTGWLEINVPMGSAIVAQRVKDKIEHYEKNNLQNIMSSFVRLNYLSKTITFLQQHGTVYLIRLPVHPGILNVENRFTPDFNQKMDSLVKNLNVKYLSFEKEGDKYIYTDGNHLHKSSAKKISKEIAEWILENK